MISIQEIKLLIEKLEKINELDFKELIKHHLGDLKTLRDIIERKERESGSFVNKGAAWFLDDLANKEKLAPSVLLYKEIKDKIFRFAKSNMYNSLEIGPGNAEFSNLFLPWDNQYYLDISWKPEKSVRYKFPDAHQKYIKFYKTDGYDCNHLPKGSVNFIFSWDTFVFFTPAQIDQYLNSMKDVLIPGGYVMIHYSDCHYDYDLEMSKKDYWAYNTQSAMEQLIEKNNYQLIEIGQFRPGANYVIFKKSGKQNPAVYKVSEITLD
tara:strand:- start:13 stop:807 length:795 start_codon:yes stop_codon:yes gene_type:complete